MPGETRRCAAVVASLVALGGCVDGPKDTGATPGCTDPYEWCDETAEAGLAVNGPAYGRGAALVDVDGDGWEDIWQSDGGGGEVYYENVSTLWMNRGDGSFAPRDIGIPDDHLALNWSASWADVDNDGDPDLLLANGGYHGPGRLWLYRNDLATTGQFTDVTDESGITTDEEGWWSAPFADYDGDGVLDFVVTSCSKHEEPTSIRLYHGLGDFRFEDVAAAAGLPPLRGDLKNPVWFDHDDDGDLDLFVAVQDREPARPFLFRNDGDVFRDITVEAFADVEHLGPVFAAAAADFDQDGHLDLYLGRWFSQDYVARNEGDGTYTSWGSEIGLDMASGVQGDVDIPIENTMGMLVGDLHGDGWPDVFVGTGYPDGVGEMLMFCATGGGLGFTRCSDDFAAQVEPCQHHGATMGDVDHDGDVDLFLNLGGHPNHAVNDLPSSVVPAFFRHHPAEPEVTSAVRLVGTRGPRDAVGARFSYPTALRTHHHVVTASQGFVSQTSAWQTIGLDADTTVSVTVTWPGGATSTHTVAAGERLDLVEP